nr:ferrous iron transporter B [Oscillospiraceae bacterium]
WLLGRWQVGGESVLSLAAAALEGPGRLLGMDGALLLAFLLGLPANEIVLPLALTVYAAGGTLGDPGSLAEIEQSLLAQGWTGWTAAAVIVFSMFHWPCSTTLLTVKKETGRWRWAALAAALPTAAGVLGCLALNALHSLIQTVF